MTKRGRGVNLDSRSAQRRDVTFVSAQEPDDKFVSRNICIDVKSKDDIV